MARRQLGWTAKYDIVDMYIGLRIIIMNKEDTRNYCSLDSFTNFHQ